MHETMHLREPVQIAIGGGGGIGNARQEGHAYATEVFFLDYAGDEEGSDLRGSYATTFGGEVAGNEMPAARRYARQMYLVWAWFMNAADLRNQRNVSPIPDNPITAGDVGMFARKLLSIRPWDSDADLLRLEQATADDTTVTSTLRQLAGRHPGFHPRYIERHINAPDHW
jgi:hypothetical protein